MVYFYRNKLNQELDLIKSKAQQHKEKYYLMDITKNYLKPSIELHILKSGGNLLNFKKKENSTGFHI